MSYSNKLLQLRAKERREAESNTRVSVWSRVKQEEPFLADSLRDLHTCFGKPDGIRIEIGGEVLIDKPAPDHRGEFWNGKLRSKNEHK